MDAFTNTATDPRCPYCGRPVLGAFMLGNEGRYHPACVEPPAQPIPWSWPLGGPKLGPIDERSIQAIQSQVEREGTIRADKQPTSWREDLGTQDNIGTGVQ